MEKQCGEEKKVWKANKGLGGYLSSTTQLAPTLFDSATTTPPPRSPEDEDEEPEGFGSDPTTLILTFICTKKRKHGRRHSLPLKSDNRQARIATTKAENKKRKERKTWLFLHTVVIHCQRR